MVEVLVIGVGGIGSVYAFVVKQAQAYDVNLSLVARSNYKTIAESGITLHSAKWGDHLVKPENVYKTVEDASASGKTFDYIFCTTKALPKAPTAPLIRPVVSLHSTIVLIQNGLSIENPVHAAFPENTIISCTAYIGVWQSSPGVVKHSALERLEVGVFPDLADAPPSRRDKDEASLSQFISILTAGGSDCKVVPSMPAARWQKLIWNASFNCVCTITGLDTSMVTSCEPAKALVLSAMREIIASANACGYALPEALIAANWENTKKMNMAYKPSMLLDYEAGREMELDVILGAPIDEARRVGVDVPTLRHLKQILDILNWKTAQLRSQKTEGVPLL